MFLFNQWNICTIILKHTIFRVKCPPSTWQIGHNYIGKTKLEGLVGVEFPASKFFARMDCIQDELWYAVKAVVIACVYDNASKMAFMWSTVKNNKWQTKTPPPPPHTQKKNQNKEIEKRCSQLIVRISLFFELLLVHALAISCIHTHLDIGWDEYLLHAS